MKIELGANWHGDCVHTSRETTHHSGGFTHRVTAVLPNGHLVKARQCWVNRTWEVFPYQCALHNLCDKIAMITYSVPSTRSLYKSKKWKDALEYADSLKKQVDKIGRCW